MINEIRNFGKQFNIALNITKNSTLKLPNKKIKNIYLCGMGGSSLPGDIINTLLYNKINIQFIRDYDIQQKTNYKNDLYILSSFSGNTEEVLSCLNQIEQIKTNFIIISHSGKLTKIAKNKKYNFLNIPFCKQPRIASGYFFTFLLFILNKIKKIDGEQLRNFTELEQFLSSNIKQLEEQGKLFAKKLYKHLPIIYADKKLKAMARIAKINFNENSKTQAFRNEIPELNHNELVGFTNLITKPYIILLKSKFMHPKNRKRMEIMENLLKNKIPFLNINAKGKNQIQELFRIYILMGFTSYYLAIENKIDPMPVQMVEEFKKKLNTTN